MKWVCRYAFLALLLIGAIAWCIYCNITVADLEKQIYSLSYIDLAASLSTDAIILLDRLDTFQNLANTGMIVCFVIGGCLLLLIAYHILSTVLSKKCQKKPNCVPADAPVIAPQPFIPTAFAEPAVIPVEEPTIVEEPVPEIIPETLPEEPTEIPEDITTDAPAVQEEAVPEEPAGVFCPNCGKFYQTAPAFCSQCGNKM